MSGFIGGALSQTIINTKDRRLVSNYQNLRRQQDLVSERYNATRYPGGYVSDYWPGGRGFNGDSVEAPVVEALWGRGITRLAHGCSSRLGFVGVTRDAAGGRLAGVTCSLFRTSTKEWIMDIVSDVNGDFLLQTFYSPDTHFIVFSKTGAPDVVGTTRQTLLGA